MLILTTHVDLKKQIYSKMNENILFKLYLDH